MSYESGFNVSAHLISSADSCFVWTLGISTDLSALLGLYSVSISAVYLGPRPLSDL